MKTVWVYADNEDFDGMAGFCDTKDEAVEEALSDLGDDDGDIFVASAEQIDPMRFCPDADEIEQHTQAQVDNSDCSSLREFDSEWPSFSDEAKAELTALMRAWWEKHVKAPNYYEVTNLPEQIDRPDE